MAVKDDTDKVAKEWLKDKRFANIYKKKWRTSGDCQKCRLSIG
jgi:hypothetical protein